MSDGQTQDDIIEDRIVEEDFCDGTSDVIRVGENYKVIHYSILPVPDHPGAYQRVVAARLAMSADGLREFIDKSLAALAAPITTIDQAQRRLSS
jgi:hypothetical protein